ncbi:MAG: MgtC/SapB family protein [Bacilli bacterium]
MDILTFIIRIIICFSLSILVGLERQWRHRMVGLRTNVLVCLGAFMFVYVSYGVFDESSTRIAAQVVSGIGFLGAGVILRDGSNIKGLNTAATLWCVAAIGVLCASGLLIEATIGTFFVLLSNILLRLAALKIMSSVKKIKNEQYTINISCKKKIEIVIRTLIVQSLNKASLMLNSLERNEITETELKLKAIILTPITNQAVIEEIISAISMEPGVTAINWSHEELGLLSSEDVDDE